MENGLAWRLSSFINWPSAISISPIRLANAGFKYIGYGDKVICPVCLLQIEGWESMRLSNPRSEHASRAPRCLLALECLKYDDDPLSPAKKATNHSLSQLTSRIPIASSAAEDEQIYYVNEASSSSTCSRTLATHSNSQSVNLNPAVDHAAAAAADRGASASASGRPNAEGGTLFSCSRDFPKNTACKVANKTVTADERKSDQARNISSESRNTENDLQELQTAAQKELDTFKDDEGEKGVKNRIDKRVSCHITNLRYSDS
jgi:hypothetical protein